VSVVGPLLLTLPHMTKGDHGSCPSHIAATSADSSRRGSQYTAGSHGDMPGKGDTPSWIHPDLGTVQPEVFVKKILRAVSSANAPWPERASMEGGTSASSGAAFEIHPEHLDGLTEDETSDLAALLGRWQSLSALCTACGPEPEAASCQRSLTQMTLRISPISARSLISNAPSGSEGALSMFVETVSDGVAWRGNTMLSSTRVTTGPVAMASDGTDVPILQVDCLDVTSRYTYPLAWKGVQQSKLEVHLGGATLCPTTNHIDSISSLLGDFSAPLDLPWVPPSLIPYSTLATSHEAGRALFIPYLGVTKLSFTDLVWMLHANGHNAIDVPGDMHANTFVTLGLPILTVALRSEDLQFSPSSYTTQFNILGGLVDDTAARKQQIYAVVTDMDIAKGIIEARGQTGEPRPAQPVANSAPTRQAESAWSGLVASRAAAASNTLPHGLRSLSAANSGHSEDSNGAMPTYAPRSLEIPALAAHFPAFHPAARARGSDGFAVDVATFPLLRITGRYTYMTGTEGEDSFGLDVAFPSPTVHATPHGIAAVLAAVKGHVGAGRRPCTTQQLEADGGSNVHSQREEAWGYAIQAPQRSTKISPATESLQGLIVSLCRLNGPPARQATSNPIMTGTQPTSSAEEKAAVRHAVSAFCSRGGGAGLASHPKAWWATYAPGTNNRVSTGEAAEMPTPIALPGGASLYATPIPRIDTSTVVTIRLPDATVLVPLQPAGAIVPLEPALHTQWYHEGKSSRVHTSSQTRSSQRRGGVAAFGSGTTPTHATMVQSPLPRHAIFRIADVRITVVSDYACSSVNIFAATLKGRLPVVTPSLPQPPPPAAPTGTTHHSLRRGSVAWSRIQRVSPRRAVSPTATNLSSASHRPDLHTGGLNMAERTPPKDRTLSGVTRGWTEVIQIQEVSFDLSFQFSAPLQGMLGPLITHSDDMRVGVHGLHIGASISQSVSLAQCSLSWVSHFFESSDPALTSPAAAPVIGTIRLGASDRAQLSNSFSTACAAAVAAQVGQTRNSPVHAGATLLAMHLHAASLQSAFNDTMHHSGTRGVSRGSQSDSMRVPHETQMHAQLQRLQTSRLLSSTIDEGTSVTTPGVLPAALTAALRLLFPSEQDPAQLDVEHVLREVRKGTQTERSIPRLDRFIASTHIVGLFLVYEHAGQTMRSSVVPLNSDTMRRLPTQGLRFDRSASATSRLLNEAANLHCGTVLQTDNEGDAVLPIRFPWAPITVSAFALREVLWVAARRRTISGPEGGAYDVDTSTRFQAICLGSRTEKLLTTVGGLAAHSAQPTRATGDTHSGVQKAPDQSLGLGTGEADESPTQWDASTAAAHDTGRSKNTSSRSHGVRGSAPSPLAPSNSSGASHGGGLALHARRAILESQFEQTSGAPPPLSTAGGMNAMVSLSEVQDASTPYNCFFSYTFGANAPETAVTSRVARIRPLLSASGARNGGTVTAGATVGSVLAESIWQLFPGGSASNNAAAAVLQVPIMASFTPQVPISRAMAPTRNAALAESAGIRNVAAAAADGAMAPLMADRGPVAVATGAGEARAGALDPADRVHGMRTRVHIGDTTAAQPLSHAPSSYRQRPTYGAGRGTGSRVAVGGAEVFAGVKHSEEWAVSVLG
jgi:hypothetical protein